MLVELASYSQNHMDPKVRDVIDDKIWRFTGFYGHPEEAKKALSWNLLSLLKAQYDLPWLCVGDFNKILLDSEKKIGANRKSHLIQNFINVINQCNLQDLGFEGYPFTWTNGREGEENIQERLDRCLASEEWLFLFPVVKVTHEKKSFSDHCPLVIEFDSVNLDEGNLKTRKFRFEEAWMKEPRCEEIVKRAWEKNGDAINNIKRIREDFLSSYLFNIKKSRGRMKELGNQMDKTQRASPTREILNAQNNILREIEELMEKKELYCVSPKAL